MSRRPRSPIVCLVTDRRRLPAARGGDGPACDALVELARAAGRAGVDIVQVRERGLGDRRLLRLVEGIVSAVEGSATRVVVNDRADIALAAGAGGVHVRSEGPPPMRVRAIAPARWLIGRSVHRPDDVRPTERLDGADYAICGTVFESASKPGRRPLGVDGLAGVARAVSLPVLAIGGVDAGNAPLVAGAGAAGVAAIGYFADGWRDAGQADLAERVGALRRAFDKGRGLAYFQGIHARR
ncbi:MAG: thiamine phosphate synthase [Acidobacteria bacterium]|nr:thiamine phosphate synthase [Acidobacteriota bacterium]